MMRLIERCVWLAMTTLAQAVHKDTGGSACVPYVCTVPIPRPHHICLNENIPVRPNHIPSLYPWALVSTELASEAMENSIDIIPVVIIGAGFSGIAIGAQLKRRYQIDGFVIYDRNPHIGGTWYTNQCEMTGAHIGYT